MNIDTDIMIAEIDEALDKIRKRELEEKDKEIERLKNELSIKTTYIEDLLKSILKSTDIKIQREVYKHGIEYDRKLKELKEGKDNLNDEVEILEEEKKIPEKLDQNNFEWEYVYSKKSNEEIIHNLNILRLKYNEIIDYIKSKENK